MGRHHGCGYGRVARSRGHVGHLIMHGCRHENRAISPTHRDIDRVAMRDLQHIPSILVLKVEVEVQTIAKIANTIHIEELLKVVLRARVHAVILVVPCCRVHHGGFYRPAARFRFRGSEAMRVEKSEGELRPEVVRQRRATMARVTASDGLRSKQTGVVELSKPPRASAIPGGRCVEYCFGGDADWRCSLNPASECAYLIGRCWISLSCR